MGEKVYFVYSGYVTPDDYDASEGPIYTLNKFFTEEQVLAFRKEFEEETCDPEYAGNVIFTVIEGVERTIKPKEKVVSFELV